MHLNRFAIGAGILILLGLSFLYFRYTDLNPTAFVTSSFQPSNPFIGKVTHSIEHIFASNPQAVIEQDGRVGLLFPGGNSVQFSQTPETTTEDVVIILNASHTTLTTYNMYPSFVTNEFTYVSPEQIDNVGPYVRAQYPAGFYLMPLDVGV
ncbi:MAG: hypothetical protein V1776_00165 [Candidatus Diapherotrites archaeon]